MPRPLLLPPLPLKALANASRPLFAHLSLLSANSFPPGESLPVEALTPATPDAALAPSGAPLVALARETVVQRRSTSRDGPFFLPLPVGEGWGEGLPGNQPSVTQQFLAEELRRRALHSARRNATHGSTGLTQ